MKYVGRTGEYFEVVNGQEGMIKTDDDGHLTMIWFMEDDNVMSIDAQKFIFQKNEILFLNAFNKVDASQIKKVNYMRFNSPFYCILDHDAEVGCKGILFYGASNVIKLAPDAKDLDILETVWKMLVIEMQSNDNLQQEMLQMMLKRILILCTRIYKAQANIDTADATKVDIVREFNYLVELHFKEKHTVSEYAALLNKSPKTLSNLFGKLSPKSPLQIIQDRKMQEVRRSLRYTDQHISEIGYEIGFVDVQSFSRFFKKHEGVSPSEFRNAV